MSLSLLSMLLNHVGHKEEEEDILLVSSHLDIAVFVTRIIHTVEFCYQKHGHPNFQKQASSINVSSSIDKVEAQSGSINEAISLPSCNISQAKYVQLINLLQQVNLLPATSSPSGVNHIHTSSSSFSSNPSSISSIFSCSLQTKSELWFLDSGVNEHIVSSLTWFTSYHKITPKPVNLPNGSSVLVEFTIFM